ncbi:MAG TPA: condensation domain-containing protein, partial [Thermoanaerobaculia bacterium]|nr:condensation domain-containing protein [Thermoanaerobaculia bacterium]
CHPMSDPGEVGRTVSIGRPIANTTVYLLGRHGEPVPVGVTGELCTGGAGLARAYWNRPALTAERFVPDATSGTPGARLYRTGDLARHLPDGRLEFLGRRDQQVKIRGFRIEPGEVEVAMVEHPAVAEAAAVVRDDEGVGRRLVGYAVAQPGSALTTESLGAFLRERLPAHLVPGALVLLPELPLTPNGKVDRRALPAPEGRPAERELVAPRTPVEAAVAEIWAELLRTGPLGIDDDFFELGGHSLLATRVVSRLKERFAVDLPLRALFEAPTVAGLAALVAGLERSREEALVPGETGPAPLSFGQQRLWFLDRLEPGSSAYNVPVAVRLTGALEVEPLRRALEEIVRRHAVLRTRFREIDGEPVQEAVAPPPLGLPPLALPTVDLGALPAERQAAAARRVVREEGARPFDLAAAPLLRGLLVRLGPSRSSGHPSGHSSGPFSDEHVLALTLHHIASDGWSLSILTRELTALYAAFAAGRPSPLPELPVQYADFARWQRRRLSGEALEAEVDHWRGRLAGVPVLELPTDRPRPRVAGTRGAARTVDLDEGLGEELLALGRLAGATPFVLLLAAFEVLLHRHAGQDDLTVGTPVAGRLRTEVEPLIGFFVNTLVLRARMAGDPSFADHLAATRDAALDAFAHQEVPFERLVEALEPQRRMDRSPLFQVMFAFQNAPRERLALGGVALAPFRVEGTTAKFDLTLAMVERGGGLGGTLEYRTDLFDETTIERLLGHWRTLLAGIVAHPEARLSSLPLLSEAERRQVLEEWNATSTAYPREATIHGLFAAQAAATPESVAVVFAGRELRYRELASASRRLARRLRAAGVGPEVRVGLWMERSLELPVALLAVLEAGGAYVPLDPDYPAERLAFMMADAGLSVLLAQGALVDRLPPHELPVVLLEEGGEATDDPSADDLVPHLEPSATGPESLAYIMYTSGSTGRPNGVCVPHRGVVRLVRETGYAALGADEVFLQLAPVSFDASTLEVWGPLLNGGRLVVMPPGPPSLAELARVIGEEGVSTLWLTAGLFHQVVEEDVASLRGLRQLLAGGDVLAPPQVRRFLEAVPGCRLINGYGPTENTTFTCCHPMSDPGEVGRTVSIGRPIANTTVYLLGRHGEPVPVGVTGELCTGG